jgi:hypothetical protein
MVHIYVKINTKESSGDKTWRFEQEMLMATVTCSVKIISIYTLSSLCGQGMMMEY